MVSSGRSAADGDVIQERFALLTTSDFVADLDRRLAAARHTVALQLMTFDGDAAGLAVARRLIEAARRGVTTRLLVDCFALRFVSDRPVRSPRVRGEFRATMAMFDDLRAAGVAVRFTNPNGPLNVFSLARNHKKLYVVDDALYLGGVNVSDHNFSWHDFMVRVDDRSLRQAVLDDFDATFAGRPTTIGVAVPGSGSGSGSGSEAQVPAGTIVTNEAVEHVFDRLVLGARSRVVVASPYALDRGLARVLERSPAPAKTVVIAGRNNFRFLRLITPYVSRRLGRAGVDLARYRQFSHSKFLLVDDDVVLIGSSNFGRHSFWCNQEIGLVIRDRGFARRFARALLADLEPAEAAAGAASVWLGAVATAAMDTYLRLYARMVVPRVAPLSDDGRHRRDAG
jgi:cardiolipin synthase